MKIAVVIPDKSDRPLFLQKAVQMMKRQTRKPDHLLIVDGDMGLDYVDLVHRYHLGFTDAFKSRNYDLVMCIENDDWYSDRYIETMMSEWEKAGRPDIFGVGHSTYYHIITQKYLPISHPGRASMMATMVTSKVLSHKFNFQDRYLDMALWGDKQFIRKTFVPVSPICIGIKHGMYQVAGGGHQIDWPKYTHEDQNYSYLEKVCGQDVAFYRIMAVKDNYEITKRKKWTNPFLTIITRKHGNRRPNGFSANQDSVNALTGTWEQIFIEDKKGMGLHYANMAFQLAVPEIEGEWVYAIDDDDKINNPSMPMKLQQIAEQNNIDVIVFRMKIKNGAKSAIWDNIYPSPICWGEKKPKLAHIGGSCFAVKAEIFKRYIHHFGKKTCGDFSFIDEIYKAGHKFYWHDELMAETIGEPSHGKVE